MISCPVPHPFLTPFGIVPCKDGHITLACHTDAFWAQLCDLIQRADLALDPRTRTEAARRENKSLVYDSIAQFTMKHTKRELLELLGGLVPFSPVYTIAEIVDDPHFAARDMIVDVEQPGYAHTVSIAGVPIKMTETPGGVRRRAPRLGEDTESELSNAGYDSGQQAALRASGILP